MSRIILIHGYAHGLETVVRNRSELGDFQMFDYLVESGEAALFEWYNLYNYNFQQSFSYEANTLVYFEEQKKAQDPETFLRLHHFLMKHEPEVIIAFSMGTFLFNNYLQKYSLPECINNIAFVQADLPIDFEVKDRKITQRLRGGHLVWQNFWCFWDPALSVSTILNRKRRLGLGKSKNPYIKDRFFPLYKNFNLHVSSLYDRNLIKQILKTQVIPPPVLQLQK